MITPTPKPAVAFPNLIVPIGRREAGSDGLIRAAFEAFVHTDPIFAMYLVYSKMYGVEEVRVPHDSGPSLKTKTEWRDK